MRAPDLDDARPRVALVVQNVAQLLQGGEQPVNDLLGTSDVHCRRVGVVRRLRHVDVVVRMHGFLRALLTAERLDGAVRNHLVGIHVRLRARTRLPDDERKMIVELTLDDVLRRFNDRVAELFVELAQSHVGFGRGALDDAEGAHDRCRLPLPTDLEIAEAALGLRAPIAVGGDFDGSERVGFRAGFVHGVFGSVHGSLMPRNWCFVAHRPGFVEDVMVM